MFFSNVRNDMTELRIFHHNEFGSVAVVLDRAFYPWFFVDDIWRIATACRADRAYYTHSRTIANAENVNLFWGFFAGRCESAKRCFRIAPFEDMLHAMYGCVEYYSDRAKNWIYDVLERVGIEHHEYWNATYYRVEDYPFLWPVPVEDYNALHDKVKEFVLSGGANLYRGPRFIYDSEKSFKVPKFKFCRTVLTEYASWMNTTQKA